MLQRTDVMSCGKFGYCGQCGSPPVLLECGRVGSNTNAKGPRSGVDFKGMRRDDIHLSLLDGPQSRQS